jgi:hypothetical protein
MLSHGRLACNARQYHAAHPDQCFVCRRTFVQGIVSTHEEIGARTCSPLCFTVYQRWWLRRRPHLHAVASPPIDTEGRSLTAALPRSPTDLHRGCPWTLIYKRCVLAGYASAANCPINRRSWDTIGPRHYENTG